MGVAETSPSVSRRDGEGTYKLVGEPAPIASNEPRLGGSTHGYTSWGAPNSFSPTISFRINLKNVCNSFLEAVDTKYIYVH
jgi:hypothetical protein